MLDEPCEGLAPLIVRDVRDAIVAINQRGVAVLLVEQKIAIPLQIGNRIYADRPRQGRLAGARPKISGASASAIEGG